VCGAAKGVKSYQPHSLQGRLFKKGQQCKSLTELCVSNIVDKKLTEKT
jgi:hypothetical protein